MSGVGFTILSLLVTIGVLVFVHELGHFVAAKAAGIHVHRFSLGLGSPIPWLTFRRGGTEYSISWIPLGGYVKMASREADPAGGALEGGPASADVPPDRVFEAKPVWARMIVILAGVAMNVLFAWLVFTGLFYSKGLTVYPFTTVSRVDSAALPPGAEELVRLAPGDRIVRVGGVAVTTWEEVQEQILQGSGDSVMIEVEGKAPIPLRIHHDAIEPRVRAAGALRPHIAPVVSQVLSGPAERAGVQLGDTILAVDGAPVTEWQHVVAAIEARPDQEVRVTLGRASGRVELTARTVVEVQRDSAGERRVGKLGLGVLRNDPLTLWQAMGEGARQTATVSTQIVRVVRGMFTGRVSTREIGGPIAIGVMAGQSARQGLDFFLAFMAMISVNLAVLNLLPIPVMDGGQFLFLVGEAVLRRPLSVRVRERLSMVGLVLIVLLIVLAFSNDIRRLLGV